MKLKLLSRTDVRRWSPWMLATIAALYVSRIAIEAAPTGWSSPTRWLIAIALGLAGFALTLVAHAIGCDVAPVAALAVYLISPTVDGHLAAAAAFIAAAGVLFLLLRQAVAGPVRQPPRALPCWMSFNTLSDAGVLLAGLLLFTTTLAPDLLPADSGEFQLVVPTLGIAHPPGYALYTLAGKLFTLIPLGSPALRLNLMSAVLGAATLMLVNCTTRRLTASGTAGLVAAAALAGATTFWAQATTANIRMPTAFFAALLLWLVVRYAEMQHERDLVLAAAVAGLGLTHHGSLVFVAVPAAGYAVWGRPATLRKGRLLLRCAAAFALALSVLLYFPLRGRADVPLNPGGLTSVGGFMDHVLARGFSGDVLAFTDAQALPDRARVLVNILLIQFGWPLLALAAAGLLAPLFQSRITTRQSPTRSRLFSPREWLLLAGSFALTAGAAITYRAPQTVEYLMPAYVALVMLAAVGATALARVAHVPALQAVTMSLAVLLGLANVWHNAPAYRELSRQSDTRLVVEPALRDAPAGATILANWHWATPLWYLQTVEGLRRDVEVDYIAPAGAEPYPETWRRRLADALDGRSVLFTSRYQTLADLPARIVPFHQFFAAQTAPSRLQHPASQLEVNFEGRIQLHGYTLYATSVQPGENLIVRLWWEPEVDAQQDYSVFVHLVDAGGRPVGQSDARYPAHRLSASVSVEDEYSLALLPTTPPGEYALLAGFYFTPPEGGFVRLTTGGADSVRLGTVTVAPPHRPPVTAHPLEVAFAGGPTLIGADYDTSRPESSRVYLHWQGAPAGPWVATLSSGGQPLAGATLPAAPSDTCATIAVDVPAEARDLALTLDSAGGAHMAALGAWRLPTPGASVRLPRLSQGDRHLVFGGEMALAGAEWIRRGDEVVVDLEWVGLKPLLRDYTISVQLLGEAGWRAQHDGTPALGAIPTLKWMPGTRVADRHRVQLPPGADGPAAVQVSVYDAFTQRPLAVLDERFQQAGQGQAAVIGSLAGR